jgi:hypothetical protein
MVNCLINSKNFLFCVASKRGNSVVKDAHLIYVLYVLENYIKENFFFCKSTDVRAMSLEVFNIKYNKQFSRGK